MTFNFDYTLSRFNDYFATHKANRSRSNGFLPDVYQIWDEVMWLTPEKGHLISSNDNPLQYSCLENPMDGGAWLAALHGVSKSRTRLSGFTFTFHFQALGKEMATHSSVLAWRIPGTAEPGGLPSTGLQSRT